MVHTARMAESVRRLTREDSRGINCSPSAREDRLAVNEAAAHTWLGVSGTDTTARADYRGTLGSTPTHQFTLTGRCIMKVRLIAAAALLVLVAACSTKTPSAAEPRDGLHDGAAEGDTTAHGGHMLGSGA
jgi:hypothetical protein